MSSPRTFGTLVVTGAAALFCVVLIFLALQVRAGRDPALGAAKPATPPRQVIVRRIIVTRVIEDGVPAAPRGSAAPSTPSAPAAVPAPAPAPVVSRGS
jgi:hypothetical protein